MKGIVVLGLVFMLAMCASGASAMDGIERIREEANELTAQFHVSGAAAHGLASCGINASRGVVPWGGDWLFVIKWDQK